jgi:hypothetical protein
VILGICRAAAPHRLADLGDHGSALVAVKLPAGKPFAVALTMMLVIALIGLVLAVLIPRKAIEAAPTPSPGPETATPQPAP